jgi:hypothetical protein
MAEASRSRRNLYTEDRQEKKTEKERKERKKRR